MPDATPVSRADISGALANVDDHASGRDPLAAGGVPAIPPELQDQMLKNAEGLTERQDKYMRDEAEAYKKLPAVPPTVESGKLGKIGAPPKNDIRGDAMMWLGFATALGGIAGAMTKRSSMNALAAFSGALDGLQQGNQTKFENDFKTWEAQAKATELNNKTEMDGYRNILERQDLDHRQRADQLEMWATQNRNKFMIELARASRNDPAIFTAALDSIGAQASKGSSALERVLQYREAERQRQQDRLELRQMMLTGGMGMQGVEEEAAEIAANRRAPYTPAQTKNNPRAAGIMAQVYKTNPDYDPRQYAAGAFAERQFAGGTLAQRVTSLNTAVNHLDFLDKLGDAALSNNIQAVNRLTQRAAIELGQPLPNSFQGIKQIVINEVVSAIVPSGGTGQDREDAQAQISTATTPEQLHDIVKRYKSLLAGRLDPLRLQYEQATGRTDFEKRLTPATRDALTPPTAPASSQAPERRTYQNKTWELTPGTDRTKQENWHVVQ